MTVVDRMGVRAERKLLAKQYKVHFLSKVWLLVEALVLAHVGVLVIVAVYYGLFETTHAMHTWWHHQVANGQMRHDIRDVAEGVLGALLAKLLLWDHFKKRHQRAGHIFDFLHNRLRIPEVPAEILLTVAFATVAFIGGQWVLHHLLSSVHVLNHSPTGSLWNRWQTVWRSNWDKKVLAFLATFIASWPMRNIFDDVQGYFAGRRVAMGKQVHFYHPITFRHRFHYFQDHGGEAAQYSQAAGVAVDILILVGLALACWGFYILTYVA